MNTVYIIQEDMGYNNFEIRGLSTDFKEIADLFETFVQLGKPTMFELVELLLDIDGRVTAKVDVRFRIVLACRVEPDGQRYKLCILR